MKNRLLQKIAVSVLSLATVASLVLQPVTVKAAEPATIQDQSVINYLALGDSMTEGDDSFVKYISSYLKTKATYYNYANYGVSGAQSKHLVQVLTNSEYSAGAKSYVQQASVITLDIGGNDIMVTAMEIVAKELGAKDIYSIGAAVQSWQNKFNACTNPWQKAYLGAQMAYKCYVINNKLTNGTELKTAVNNYRTNLDTILKTIHNWNPNCKVYVGNVYGTNLKLPTYTVNGYTVFDTNKFASTWIPQLNKIISDTAPRYGYPVVDVNSAMNSASYLIGGSSVYDFNIHPNESGKKAISNAFLAHIKKDF